MALHRLTSVCIGVPNVAETAAYYEEFGLTRLDDDRFATVDGGEQLRIVHSPRRRSSSSASEWPILRAARMSVPGSLAPLERVSGSLNHRDGLLTTNLGICAVRRHPRSAST